MQQELNRHDRRAHAAHTRVAGIQVGTVFPGSEPIRPPRRLSILGPAEDRVPTLAFLKVIRRRIDEVATTHRFHVDMSGIQDVDLASALALTAEFDRWQAVNRRTLGPIDYHSWNVSVRKRLISLGFFRLLGTKVPLTLRTRGSKSWIPFLSAQETHGKMAAELRLKLEGAFGEPIGIQREIYGSLVEAMKNAFQHAYPEGVSGASAAMSLRRWWMAGMVDIGSRSVRIAFLDQGVTIPATLPNSPMWADLVGKHATRAFRDAALIGGAMTYGETRLRLEHRGKGFSDICRPARLVEGNSVRVLSRDGLCEMLSDGSIQLRDAGIPFSGTLIEWLVNVPEPTRVPRRISAA